MFHEIDYNQALARCWGGEVEKIYHYHLGSIRVDVETENYVIEAGLDKRTSLDSIHQVLFAAYLSGKKPMIIIYDTNQKEGAVEYQLRVLVKSLGILYYRIPAKTLEQNQCPNF